MKRVSPLIMMAAAFGIGMSYRNSRPDPLQTQFPRNDAGHRKAAKERRQRRAARKSELAERALRGKQR